MFHTDFRDAMVAAHDLVSDKLGLVGYGVINLYEGDEAEGSKLLVPFGNLITDAGDLYVAGKIVTAIGTAAPAAPTPANGMKLGTGVTAVAKSGAGGALVTYLAASNVAFDAAWAQTVNLGAGLGVNAQHKTTWIAGVATNSALREAVIVNDRATDATTTAANTYSRILFTAIDKLAADSLAITWNYKALGV